MNAQNGKKKKAESKKGIQTDDKEELTNINIDEYLKGKNRDA